MAKKSNKKFVYKNTKKKFSNNFNKHGSSHNDQSDDSAETKSIQLEGVVHTVLPGTMFRVKLQNDKLVLGHISGKMRKRFIKLVTGDRVKIEMSPYDLEKARIIYRL